jgi:hypothetical protein
MVCKDADFVWHAKDEYACWEQGATITLKEYMASALTKYKTLQMKGVWEAPSPKQEQIIALHGLVATNTEPAAETIALLVMPFMMAIIMNGKFFKYLLSAILLTTRAMVAEAELSALLWLPAIVVMSWTYQNGPVPLPPEKGAYVPRRNRPSTEGLLNQYVPVRWQKQWRASVGPRLQQFVKIPPLWSKKKDCRSHFKYRSYLPSLTRQAR